MRSVFDALGGSVRWSGRMALYGVRMAAWTILTALRRPMQLVCGLVTFSGWIGGVIAMPAILAYANANRGIDFGWEAFALFIGVGLAMGLLAPIVAVKYDSLLFWLEPKDRVTLYY